MKRPRSNRVASCTGDIRKDFSPDQLASLGAMALAYNEAEVLIDILLSLSLNLGPESAPAITSRINGIDGKIEIAKTALKELGANSEIKSLVSDTFSKGAFQKYKQYRDAAIHAHTMDAPSGIAATSVKRGQFFEVLLTVKALDGLYNRVVIIREELTEACNLAIALTLRRRLDRLILDLRPLHPQAAASFVPTKSKNEQDIQAVLSRYRTHQKRRQSLPQLPEFPSESELLQLRAQWMQDRLGQRLGWFVGWSDPVSAPRLRPEMIRPMAAPRFPPPDEKK